MSASLVNSGGYPLSVKVPDFLLADRLFLVLHDRASGRCRVRERVAGVGLAAALLGELVLGGAITTTVDTVVTNTGRRPQDALALQVYQVLCQSAAPVWVQDWLHTASGEVPGRVAQRLVAAGHLRVSHRRFSGKPRYLPVDLNAAAWPESRLVTDLTHRAPMSTVDTVLGGLLLTTGLRRTRLRGISRPIVPKPAIPYLTQVVGLLPEPLRLLIAHTEEAVGDAVFRRHRSTIPGPRW
jgi:Golgi phosphoprotein 3 (GPP34)